MGLGLSNWLKIRKDDIAMLCLFEYISSLHPVQQNQVIKQQEGRSAAYATCSLAKNINCDKFDA